METKKQLDRLLMEETNVKEIRRECAQTDKGLLELVFDGKDYKFYLGGVEMLESSQTRMEKFIPQFLNINEI